MGRKRIDFVSKAKLKHGDVYDYSSVIFIDVNKKIKIICKKHGEFEQLAHSHLTGKGCSKCAFEKMPQLQCHNKNKFVELATKKHGSIYDYSKVVYVNNIIKVKIMCSIHGEFEQTPEHHKKGHGCRECANIKIADASRRNSYGWSLTEWKKKIKETQDATPRIYVLKCFNETETFIKVGITMRSLEKRYKGDSEMPYKYKVLLDVEASPELVFKTEKLTQKEFKKEQYTPSLLFCGRSESLSINAETEILKFVLQNITNEIITIK